MLESARTIYLVEICRNNRDRAGIDRNVISSQQLNIVEKYLSNIAGTRKSNAGDTIWRAVLHYSNQQL